MILTAGEGMRREGKTDSSPWRRNGIRVPQATGHEIEAVKLTT